MTKLNKVLAFLNAIMAIVMMVLGVIHHDAYDMSVAIINIIIVKWNLEKR